MSATEGFAATDEWNLLKRYFPPGWEAAARSLGAMRRTRGIRDPATLLRCLLVHLAEGCSLAETAVRVRAAGWAAVSAVALFKRLRAAEEWLRWLAEQLWRQARPAPAVRGRRVRVVDATTVDEPGRTGSVWRVHYVLNLADLRCDHFQVTTPAAGEQFQRIPVQPGDLLLGDRAYGRPPGVAHVCRAGGDVLVRINLRMLPLFETANGRRLPILSRLRRLRVGEVRSWPAWVRTDRDPIRGRLVAIKRSAVAAQRAQEQLARRAARRQRVVSQESAEAAHYVFVWTSLPEADYPAEAVIELYRLRWQIELTFKRMKSLLGFGQLPKHSDASARAWLHGKLFVALLIERLIEESSLFSPWGFDLATATKPLARDALHGS
jgi:Transposase DDE domain